LNENSLIILALKITLIADVLAVLVFIGDYSRLAKWWSNPIGRTIVIKDFLLVLAFVPSILSLFFRFTRFGSMVAAWFDVAIFSGIAAVMLWRVVIFERIHRHRSPTSGDPPDQAM
jgi:hypothetical protein